MKLTKERMKDEWAKFCTNNANPHGPSFEAGWRAAKIVSEQETDVTEGFEVRPVPLAFGELRSAAAKRWPQKYPMSDLEWFGFFVQKLNNVRATQSPLLSMELFAHTLEVWGNGTQPKHYNGPSMLHCYAAACLDLPKD